MEINTEISTSSLIRVKSHLTKAPGARAKMVSGREVMSKWGWSERSPEGWALEEGHNFDTPWLKGCTAGGESSKAEAIRKDVPLHLALFTSSFVFQPSQSTPTPVLLPCPRHWASLDNLTSHCVPYSPHGTICWTCILPFSLNMHTYILAFQRINKFPSV